MGCFDFPLSTLTLGCRRNFEGNVLQSDWCNEEPSTDIFDLPIVRDCRKQMYETTSQTCTSNYCVTDRAVHANQYHDFSRKAFDLFTSTTGNVFPAGICMKIQDLVETSKEIYLGGVRICRGHACFTLKKPYYEPFTVVSLMMSGSQIYKTGTSRILNSGIFICEQNMCNSNLDEETVFKDFYVGKTDGTDCNCIAPPLITSGETTNVFKFPLFLSISIPVVFVLLVASVVLRYRLYKKQSPQAFLCGKPHANGRIG
ncbi:hypothetical protein PRIPAC_80954 [Pristionchus pacificus]|uniref:Uncharacterized protein n=1 Tax=Pristionchus pacificus TaxID=54126 RepID=A0A2A6C3J2_PRIPA|nr:hypothetical protein PRIPAC_80954 [Pristionchus pacificus]|eukprot:PDM72745.1 hypothetical protein PRIPAC_39179 [Pristionchus pacificus]